MKFCVIVIISYCFIFGQADVGLTINQEGAPVPYLNILGRTAPIKNLFNFLQGNQLRYGGSQARALSLSGGNTRSFSHSESFSSGASDGQSQSSSSSLSFTGLPNNVLFNTYFNGNNVAFSSTKEPSRSINVDNYRSKIDVRYDNERPIISEWDNVSRGKSTPSSTTFSVVPVANSFASSSSGSIRGGSDVFSHSQAASFSDGHADGSESLTGAISSSNPRNVAGSSTESKSIDLERSGLFANEKPSHSLSGSINKGPNFELGGNTFLIKEYDGLEKHGAGSFFDNIHQNGESFTTSQGESSGYQSVNGGSSPEAYNELLNHKNGAISGSQTNGGSFSQAESASIENATVQSLASSSGLINNDFQYKNRGSINPTDSGAYQSENNRGFFGNGGFSGSQAVSSMFNNHNGGSFSSSKTESVSAQNRNGGNLVSSQSGAFNKNSQNGGSFSTNQAESTSGILNEHSTFSNSSQAGSLQFNNHNGGSFSRNQANPVGVENEGNYAARKHENRTFSSTQAGNQNVGNDGSFSGSGSSTNGRFLNHGNEMQTGLMESFPKNIELFTNYNNAFSNSQSESSSSSSASSSSAAGSKDSGFGNSQASSLAGNSFSSSQAGSFGLTGQNSEASSLAHNIFLNGGVVAFAESQSGSISGDFRKGIELFANPNGASRFSNSHTESSSGSFATPFHEQQTFSSSKSKASSGSAAYQHGGTFASTHSGTNPMFVNKGNVAFNKSHASSSGSSYSESK